jgi:hypothetical protein
MDARELAQLQIADVLDMYEDEFSADVIALMCANSQPSVDWVVTNIIELIKKHNLSKWFDPAYSTESMENTKSMWCVLTMLNISTNIMGTMLHDMHYKFCKCFRDTFGFFPIFMDIQKRFDMSMFDDAFDKFMKDTFNTSAELGTLSDASYIAVEDYFSVYKRYTECMSGEHGETHTINESVQKGEYGHADALLMNIGYTEIQPHDATIDVTKFHGVLDLRRVFGDIKTIGYSTYVNYFNKNYL